MKYTVCSLIVGLLSTTVRAETENILIDDARFVDGKCIDEEFTGGDLYYGTSNVSIDSLLGGALNCVADVDEQEINLTFTFDKSASGPGGTYKLYDFDSLSLNVWMLDQGIDLTHTAICPSDTVAGAGTIWTNRPDCIDAFSGIAEGLSYGWQPDDPGGPSVGPGLPWLPGNGQEFLFQSRTVTAYNLGDGTVTYVLRAGDPNQNNTEDHMFGPGSASPPPPHPGGQLPRSPELMIDFEYVECLEDDHCTSQDPNTGKVCWVDAICDVNVCFSGSARPDTFECDAGINCDGVNPDCPDPDLGFCAEEFNWAGGSWNASSTVNWQGDIWECQGPWAAFCGQFWLSPGGFWSQLFGGVWDDIGDCEYEPCPVTMPDAWEFMGGYGYGDLVIGTNGETYECKSEPYTPWCEQRQPVTGLGWAEAWALVSGCNY